MKETKLKITITLLIVIFVCLILGANAWKSNLIVKQIKINNNQIVTESEILQLIQLQTGTNLYKVDLTELQKRILTHYYIKEVIIERNLPSTINIRVEERIPIAMIINSQIYYLDEEGIVLPRITSQKIFDLPILSGLQEEKEIIPGNKIKNDDIIESLKLLSIIKTINRAMYYNISEIFKQKEGDIILYSAEGSFPIIFGKGDTPSKIVLLETFWNDVVQKYGAHNLEYIDLRYKDQIVVRRQNEKKITKI